MAPAPIVVGVPLVRHLTAGRGPHSVEALWTVTGILSFFLVLDAVVGLGGSLDPTVAASGSAVALVALYRRVRCHPYE